MTVATRENKFSMLIREIKKYLILTGRNIPLFIPYVMNNTVESHEMIQCYHIRRK